MTNIIGGVADAVFRSLTFGSLLVAAMTVLLVVVLRISGKPGQARDRVFLTKVTGMLIVAAMLAPAIAPNMPAWFFHIAGGPIPGFVPASILILWLIGVFISFGRLVRSARALSRVVCGSHAVANHDTMRVFRDAVDEFNIERSITLRYSNDVAVPFTSGWLRLTIMLPRTALSWSEDRLRIVLRHELIHARKNDWAFLIFLNCVSAVLWFHPGVRWLRSSFAREIELACDETLLTSGTPADTYADHVLAIARESRGLMLSLAVPFSREARALEHRLSAVFGVSPNATTSVRLRVITAGIFTTGLAAGAFVLITTACPVSALPVSALLSTAL